MQRVRVDFVPGGGWACLRELSGVEEQAVTGTGTLDAIRLLEGVLVETTGSAVTPRSAAALTAADRDRLLAAIYIETYGPRIANTLGCVHCGALFDVAMSLEDLFVYLRPPTPEPPGDQTQWLADGTFRLSNGIRFRLPTGADECAVLGLPVTQAEQVLLQRCVIEGNLAEDGRDTLNEAVQTSMEDLAPVLDLDLDAHCLECDRHQPAHFDMQHYLLSALRQERGQLAREVHRLASAYGWSLSEILSLPRSQRRSLVALIEAERAPRRRAIL